MAWCGFKVLEYNLLLETLLPTGVVPSADLDIEDDQGYTALDSAVSARQQKAMTFLLLHGAKIKARYALLLHITFHPLQGS